MERDMVQELVFGIDIHTIALYLYSHIEQIVPDAIWGCGPIKSDISHTGCFAGTEKKYELIAQIFQASSN